MALPPSTPTTAPTSHTTTTITPTPKTPTFTILPARTPTHLSATKTLFETYATSLPISLDFQDFATELSSLPGAYAPPGGEILLAYSLLPDQATLSTNSITPTSSPLAILALRPLPTQTQTQERTCELKRLYVTPPGRGHGIGRALVLAMLEIARERGYKEVRLDTLESMDAALGLYRGVGFGVVERYYETPVEGTVFMGMTL